MDDTKKEKKPGRPVFLYVLCTLSVCSNVISMLILILLLIGGISILSLDTIPVVDIIAEELKHGNVLYYLIKIGIHLFCIFSVAMIARKLRTGFLFYVLSQVVLLITPWIFLFGLGVNYLFMSTLISLIFSLFFIMLFALYLPRKAKPAL
jgi:hypothetical protein